MTLSTQLDTGTEQLLRQKCGNSTFFNSVLGRYIFAALIETFQGIPIWNLEQEAPFELQNVAPKQQRYY